MSSVIDLNIKTCQQFLSKQQKALIADVDTVLNRLTVVNHINDYSFLVAPIAKAYEGFLKDFFLKIGIIDKFDHESDHFRVGRTLNPSLRYEHSSIFQKLANLHQDGEALAEILWDAWKFGRNEIFHYFPNSLKNLNRFEAESRINLLLNAMIKAGQFIETNKHLTVEN